MDDRIHPILPQSKIDDDNGCGLQPLIRHVVMAALSAIDRRLSQRTRNKNGGRPKVPGSDGVVDNGRLMTSSLKKRTRDQQRMRLDHTNAAEAMYT